MKKLLLGLLIGCLGNSSSWAATYSATYNGGGSYTHNIVRFYIGSTDLGIETDYKGTINAGDSYTFTSGSKTAPAPGTYTVKAVADSQCDVAESNEGNKEGTVSVTVRPQTGQHSSHVEQLERLGSGRCQHEVHSLHFAFAEQLWPKSVHVHQYSAGFVLG